MTASAVTTMTTISIGRFHNERRVCSSAPTRAGGCAGEYDVHSIITRPGTQDLKGLQTARFALAPGNGIRGPRLRQVPGVPNVNSAGTSGVGALGGQEVGQSCVYPFAVPRRGVNDGVQRLPAGQGDVLAFPHMTSRERDLLEYAVHAIAEQAQEG